MDLRDKLGIFGPQVVRSRTAGSSAGRSNDLEQWVCGRSVQNNHGQYFLASESYPSDYLHGSQILNTGLNNFQSLFAWIGRDASLSSATMDSMLFLDTETTGLAGGAGTVPFMIGLGYYSDSDFIIEQYFMRDFPEERAMLSALRDRVSHFKTIVTFNGKCFDINLLNTRFIIHRMPDVFGNMPHLDMLFAARRLYKRRLNDCSLASIENHVLDFHRIQDVPGFIIPGLYFQYLRSGRAREIAQVFTHNRWDILSLISLTLHTVRAYQYSDEVLKNEMDLISLGRAFESLDLVDQAAACYEKAFRAVADQKLEQEVLFRLAHVYKRLGRCDHAVPLWKRLTGFGQTLIEPYEELAKYYEHHSRDYPAAIEWVQAALNRLEIREQLESGGWTTEDRRRLVYRLDRLRRKGRRQD